jgi:hypothetical protein
MTTLRDLAAWCTDTNDQLPKAVSDLAVSVALAVVDDLALITPTDTGAALSNWQVTLNAPADSEIPAYAPSQKGYWRDHIWQHSVDPQVTRSANAPLVIDNAALTLASKQPGEAIFITNIVGTDKQDQSYILHLDNGNSPQFIGDFRGRESIVVENVLNNAKLILK